MEIKLNLKLETLLTMLTFLENMDMETFALIAVAIMMIPFIIYSLWSLTFALFCQLFWLGVKAGLVLMTVCSMIMGVLKFSAWRPGGVAGVRAFGMDVGVGGGAAAAGAGEVKCTMMDVVLTVLFQAGVRVPSGIWNGLMDNFVKNSGGGGGGSGGDVVDKGTSSKISKKKGVKGNKKKVGSSSSGAGGQISGCASEEEAMMGGEERNLDGVAMAAMVDSDMMDIFEDVGASGDYFPPTPRSGEEAIIKGILLDEAMSSSSGEGGGAQGETGTRRKTRGGRKRVKNNNN